MSRLGATRAGAMHELSIAQSLIDMASSAARRARAPRVTRLRCRIGVLRQVEHDFLHDAFSIAREGTCCAGAELCVERVPLRAQCATCRYDFVVERWDWTCPRCGGEGEPRPGGDELELLSIDAEAEADG